MENITDSELLKIAENWSKEMPINIGIKTAFAAGYRMAEIKAKNCTISDVSKNEVAGCDYCIDEQGFTIGNMYVCDKCGRQVP